MPNPPKRTLRDYRRVWFRRHMSAAHPLTCRSLRPPNVRIGIGILRRHTISVGVHFVCRSVFVARSAFGNEHHPFGLIWADECNCIDPLNYDNPPGRRGGGTLPAIISVGSCPVCALANFCNMNNARCRGCCRNAEAAASIVYYGLLDAGLWHLQDKFCIIRPLERNSIENFYIKYLRCVVDADKSGHV